LPLLPIERWAKSSGEPPDIPVVLTVEGTHGPIIHAVTQAAATRGARAGARLADARAIDPGIVALPADPAGDDAAVRALARWAARWSPLVEVDGDSLKLDVTGAAHLFGGERGLVEDISDRFAALGLTARVVIAPTAAAAWALARFSERTLTPTLSRTREREGAAKRRKGEGLSDLAAILAPLPVAALRLSPQAVRTLERLGLKTIGALAGIERRSLARRFRDADNPVDALDRALGRKADPLTAQPDERPPRVILRLAEPVADPSAAVQALDLLIPGLVRELQRRQLGARRLALTGFRVDGSVGVASVATSIASREPGHLKRLLIDKAATLDPGFGFDAFALEASWAEPLAAAQGSLVGEPSGTRELARLVDRLSVKLGPGAVKRPRAHQSHVPERASGWVSAVEAAPLPRAGGVGGGPVTKGRSTGQSLPPTPSRLREREPRPQRLLDRPEAIAVIYATPEGLPRRFVWRRAMHDIARVEGPERIAPEWWRERSTARLRDYYRVEDDAGRRYWIYREGLIGDGRGGAPEWYLHGLFG
jgi:protein ImuB